MLTVSQPFPSFSLQAVVGRQPDFATLTQESFAGRWLVVFAWPMDFTFVCPTEIAAFGEHEGDFRERNAQVLGMSTDSHFVHLAWRGSHPALRELPFPMLADTKRELSTALGILHPQEGVCLRATFIVDPQGVIRWACANDLQVGRNVPEVLRTLDALQTDGLTPCNWKRGEKLLKV